MNTLKFSNGYEVTKDSKKAKGETNDCVVRAIANACEVSYDEAHKVTKEVFKRKDRKGTFGTSITLKHLSANKNELAGGKKVKYLGCSPTTRIFLFERDENNRRQFTSNTTQSQRKEVLRNPKYKNHVVGFTVASFMKNYKKGTYILLVPGHALTIKDGTLLDNPEYSFEGWSRDVKQAFKII